MSPSFLPLAAALLLVSAGTAAAQSYAEAPAPGLQAGSAFSGMVSVGTMYAGRFGAASYLNPVLGYQLTRRFRVFAGGTYLRTFPGVVLAPGPTAEGGAATPVALRGFNRYFIQGGGTYDVSNRLSLTGTAWKELTPLTTDNYRVNPYAGFGQGMSLRADYHITPNFSVSGGLRMTQGGYPGAGYTQPGAMLGF